MKSARRYEAEQGRFDPPSHEELLERAAALGVFDDATPAGVKSFGGSRSCASRSGRTPGDRTT